MFDQSSQLNADDSFVAKIYQKILSMHYGAVLVKLGVHRYDQLMLKFRKLKANKRWRPSKQLYITKGQLKAKSNGIERRVDFEYGAKSFKDYCVNVIYKETHPKFPKPAVFRFEAQRLLRVRNFRFSRI